MDAGGGAGTLKPGINMTTKELLNIIKIDEGGRVRSLTDKELSDLFHAVRSSHLLSSAWWWF